MKNKSKIELLAPVGSFENLIAAVQNGCDAVYLGGTSFSARASAANFDDDEMKSAVEYAHMRGVSVYVTVNTVLSDVELREALAYIAYLNEIDVDGIIVQDIGLARGILKLFPDMEVHGSTQMTVNNLDGAKLLEEIGFSRIVLARETHIEEIRLIKQYTDLAVEVFAHGALCVSYSGQCLMSSMIGGRSGNRGRCAQPCRKEYNVVMPNGDVVSGEKAYLLSPKDLNTLDMVEELIEAGVDSLKIEGRMKRPEYVATVIGAYRRAIDGVSERDDKKNVEQIFNRGFTKGLMFHEFGKDFVNVTRPNNRGIRIGKVIETKKNRALIKLERPLNIGDGIEFITESGKRDGLFSTESAKAGSVIWIDIRNVVDGSEVRRTSDANLNEKAKSSYAEERVFIPLQIYGEFKLGRVGKLVGVTEDYTVEVSTENEIEESMKAPMTIEKIEKQLEKLGGTNYLLETLDVSVDENIFIPVSVINSLRRELLDELSDKYISLERVKPSASVVEEHFSSTRTGRISKGVKLAIEVNSTAQFAKLDLKKADRIVFAYLGNLQKDIGLAREYGVEVFYKPDRILFTDDMERLKIILSKIEGIDGICANNLGVINAFKGEYKILADGGINVFNSEAVKFLEDIDVHMANLSPELTFKQIRDINSKTDENISLGASGYGFATVMTMKHCPMAAVKGCVSDDECATCEYAKNYSLRDGMNVDFTMMRRNNQTLIYNSYPLLMIDNIDEYEKSGLNYVNLKFTRDDEPIELVQNSFYEKLNGKLSSEDLDALKIELKDKYNDLTKGHFYRGIE